MRARHFSAAVLLGALLAATAGVLAQSGGYPTIARFLRIGVGTAPPSASGTIAYSGLVQKTNAGAGFNIACFRNSSGSAGDQSYGIRYGGGGDLLVGVGMADDCSTANGAPLISGVKSGANMGPVRLFGSSLTYAGPSGAANIDMTPSSGTFTASYLDACSTTPTQSVRWYKIGDVVTLTADAAFTCTSDTTLFECDSGCLPAAIRPTTSAVRSSVVGAQNNTTSATAILTIRTDGEISVERCGAVTGTCVGGAWTNSGTKGVDPWTVTYVR